MRIQRGLALGGLVWAILLAGCASTNGLSPEASLRDPNHLAVEKSLASTPLSSSAWRRADWWTAFNDPQLDALIDEVLADSPTPRVAEARTRKALAFAATAPAGPVAAAR